MPGNYKVYIFLSVTQVYPRQPYHGAHHSPSIPRCTSVRLHDSHRVHSKKKKRESTREGTENERRRLGTRKLTRLCHKIYRWLIGGGGMHLVRGFLLDIIVAHNR